MYHPISLDFFLSSGLVYCKLGIVLENAFQRTANEKGEKD